MKKPKLFGPAPVSRLCLAADELGIPCDSSRERAEVILDFDGNPLTWRPWSWNGAEWKPGIWCSPTPEMRQPAVGVGGAA